MYVQCMYHLAVVAASLGSWMAAKDCSSALNQHQLPGFLKALGSSIPSSALKTWLLGAIRALKTHLLSPLMPFLTAFDSIQACLSLGLKRAKALRPRLGRFFSLAYVFPLVPVGLPPSKSATASDLALKSPPSSPQGALFLKDSKRFMYRSPQAGIELAHFMSKANSMPSANMWSPVMGKTPSFSRRRSSAASSLSGRRLTWMNSASSSSCCGSWFSSHLEPLKAI